MAKKVYITNEQYNALKKVMTEDDNSKPMVSPLINEPSDINKSLGTLLGEFDREAQEKGVKGKVVPSIPSNQTDAKRMAQMCSKVYTKKQLEESRIDNILKNSKTYTKTDFQKNFF